MTPDAARTMVNSLTESAEQCDTLLGRWAAQAARRISELYEEACLGFARQLVTPPMTDREESGFKLLYGLTELAGGLNLMFLQPVLKIRDVRSAIHTVLGARPGGIPPEVAGCLVKYFILYALWHASVRNVDRRRRELQRREPSAACGPDIEQADPGQVPPDQQAQQQEEASFYEQIPAFVGYACNQLDSGQYAILRGYYEGKSIEQIADDLGDAPKRISDRWRYVRQKVLPNLLTAFCRREGLPDPGQLFDDQ